MSIDDKELEDFMPALDLEWTDEAQTRMKNVPFFVRKSVVRGIEQYAKDKSIAVVDDGVVSRARQEREGEAMELARKNGKRLRPLMEENRLYNVNTSVSLSTNSTLRFADFLRKSVTRV